MPDEIPLRLFVDSFQVFAQRTRFEENKGKKKVFVFVFFLTMVDRESRGNSFWQRRNSDKSWGKIDDYV